MTTNYSKGRASSMSETDANGNAWNILTAKTTRGIECYAVQGQDNGGSFSYMLFGGKRLNALATSEGIATEKRIRETHERGLVEFARIQATEPLIAAKPALGIGSILFTDWPQGGDERRRAIYKIESPGHYKTVMLDGSGFSHDDHVAPYSEKFGIGTYYKEGDVITEAEVLALVEQATIAEGDRWKAKHQASEEEKVDRANKISEGKKILSQMPLGQVSVIIAHLREDDSDPYSDYFSHKTVKNVFLAFSHHNRDLFPELRQAALNFEETAHLFDCPKEWENREKYSMGPGYYLGQDRHSGWSIQKHSLSLLQGDYGTTLEELQIGIAENRFFCNVKAQITPTGANTAHITEATCKINDIKRGIELYFPEKPSPSTLEDLKANGFRWGKFNKCWYIKDSANARIVAGKYAKVPEIGVPRNYDAELVQAQENAYVDNEWQRTQGAGAGF